MTDNTNDTVADWLRQEAERRQQAAELRPINKAALFDVLAEAGITQVTVSFDGSGDSGQIESVEAFAGDNATELPAGDVELVRPGDSGGSSQRTTHTVPDAIETLAYDLLEDEHDGWENNDGAFGEFTFDVKERSITLGYNERFSDSTYHEHSF
jgi:hypothetical protein